MPVEVPDRFAGALADLAILGAADRLRRNGGGHLAPELAALLARLAAAHGSRPCQSDQTGAGDVTAAPRVPLTTGQAAARLGLTARRVRQMATAGLVPARRHGRDWAIELPEEDGACRR